MAIGQVIPYLKKHTYMHWEEDAKDIKTSWEVKDCPQKQKKCAKCCKTGHFHHNCPLRAAYQQRLYTGDGDMVGYWHAHAY